MLDLNYERKEDTRLKFLKERSFVIILQLILHVTISDQGACSATGSLPIRHLTPRQ